jgi:preprotein translocase subunit SecE
VASLKTTFTESYDELVHKVTWPSWKQLQSSSILVLVASVIIALIIFLMDYIFGVQVVAEAEEGAGFVWRGILGFIYKALSGGI